MTITLTAEDPVLPYLRPIRTSRPISCNGYPHGDSLQRLVFLSSIEVAKPLIS